MCNYMQRFEKHQQKVFATNSEHKVLLNLSCYIINFDNNIFYFIFCYSMINILKQFFDITTLLQEHNDN